MHAHVFFHKVHLVIDKLEYYIYTISERFDFLEIPYILTWALNDRYMYYKVSM